MPEAILNEKKQRKVLTLNEKRAKARFSETDMARATEIVSRGHNLKLEGEFYKLCGHVIPTEMGQRLRKRVALNMISDREWSA